MSEIDLPDAIPRAREAVVGLAMAVEESQFGALVLYGPTSAGVLNKVGVGVERPARWGSSFVPTFAGIRHQCLTRERIEDASGQSFGSVGLF